MEKGKCEIHNCPLIQTKVPIHYGLPVLDEELIEARRKLFPNSKSYVLGGCTFLDESGSEELVCPECREAEAEWRSAHDKIEQKGEDTEI